MKAKIDFERCQGHGRCYDIAPGVFGEDGEGYGTVLAHEGLGDGVVPPDAERLALLAEANCPESAISLSKEA